MQLNPHQNEVFFDIGVNLMASCSSDSTAIYNLDELACTTTFQSGSNAVLKAVLSPDEQLVAVVSEEIVEKEDSLTFTISNKR
jgi:hypothetical protein